MGDGQPRNDGATATNDTEPESPRTTSRLRPDKAVIKEKPCEWSRQHTAVVVRIERWFDRPGQFGDGGSGVPAVGGVRGCGECDGGGV